ncbi:hypothetical protein [Clostridium sp. C8]|uniref:hypothetical protein n=1 Tax=Clostridium sp. C8 TaxID=1667357 RepID=UPI00062E8564|nr:hypothetical protein [Clostridium sp. C8]KLE16074.1 hypothetical protein AAT22_07760 [Clostridium sp. C8]
MRLKKIKVIFSVVIIILLGLIGYIVNGILNKETKEVIVAKKFIENLSDEKIINNSDYYKEAIEEEALNKLNSKSSQIQYSVIVGNYGVDIDKNYNVLGFSNKNLGANTKLAEISEEEAISLATKYIKKITDDEFMFKEIKSREKEDSPCYNVVFYKCKDGYPYYKQEINTSINKVTGKLESYSNYPLDNIKHIKDINIDEYKAKNIVQNYFINLNLKSEILDKPMIAFVSVNDNEMALSFVYNVKTIDDKNKEEKYIIYIRADLGEVINYNLESSTNS